MWITFIVVYPTTHDSYTAYNGYSRTRKVFEYKKFHAINPTTTPTTTLSIMLMAFYIAFMPIEGIQAMGENSTSSWRGQAPPIVSRGRRGSLLGVAALASTDPDRTFSRTCSTPLSPSRVNPATLAGFGTWVRRCTLSR